jgi:hypothetical protein
MYCVSAQLLALGLHHCQRRIRAGGARGEEGDDDRGVGELEFRGYREGWITARQDPRGNRKSSGE